MRKRMVVGVVVLATSGLMVLAAPARACTEVGDPACTVDGAVNASLCIANEVVKGGGKTEMHEIRDCFLQTTGRSNDLADTGVTEKVECMFRVYIQEGGESGLDCLI
jgi:hypothetical protein